MRNKWSINHLILGASFLVLLIIVGSWIGSLNNIPVRNMLSTEGVRWILKNIVNNVEASPFISLFILLTGFSILKASGFFRCFSLRKRKSYAFLGLSGKRLQAFLLATFFFIVYVGIVLVLTFSRYEILLSITGGLERSPFLSALPFLIFVGCTVWGGIYGLASGVYQGLTDVVKGAISVPAQLTGYFIYVMIVSQLLAIWNYSDIDVYMDIDSSVMTITGWILYYVPLFGLLVVRRKA